LKEKNCRRRCKNYGILRKYAKDTKKLEIIELTDAQKAEWKKVMEGIYPKFYDVIGEDLIKKAIDTK
jgi:C4-dicarboxylate-binding protein DctP